MRREEQLLFCRQCTNRKMDMQQGMLCGLTQAKADFEGECPSFDKDEEVAPIELSTTEIAPGEVEYNLSEVAFKVLKKEQNFAAGIGLGIGTGLLGAFLWGLITATTKFQIGFMAIGVAAMVGHAMQFGGKGVEKKFGHAGAVLALLACAAGNLFSSLVMIGEALDMTVVEVWNQISIAAIPDIMVETFHPMDILFYGIALFEGYKFSFRKVDKVTMLAAEKEAENEIPEEPLLNN